MGQRVATPLRLSLLMSVPLWCAFMAQASAACSSNAPTTNGQTVDCTGTDTVGVNAVTNNVTGTTVNVANGASVAVTYSGVVAGTPPQRTGAASNYLFNSIIVQDGSTVNNAGTISITNNNGTTLRRDFNAVNLQGTNTTLINDGAIVATNNDLTTGTAARRVYGVISSSPTDGVNYENVKVVNNGTITVNQAGVGVARGIYSGEGIDSMSIDNFGTISVTHNGAPAAPSAAVAAIDADDDTDQLTVHNHAGATMTATGAGSFTVGGRAQEYTVINDGTITNVGGRAAILIYGASDEPPATTTITNTKTGVVNGDVYVTELTPINATTPLPTPGSGLAGVDISRDSNITNAGKINGSVFLGMGNHVLDNSGAISGNVTVDQRLPNDSPARAASGTSPAVPAGPVAPGGRTFTFTNSGTLGGNVTINDVDTSVNKITLVGTGFDGNIAATTGAGSNTLNLRGVTNLGSVQNFSNLGLNQSNVTVANGISLVPNATVRTTVYGQGGTLAAPSTKLGTINGTLTLNGATTLVPTFATLVRNGDVYQVASAVDGAGANNVKVRQNGTALVQATASGADGRLLLTTQVRDPRTIPGVNQPAGATLQGLLSYNGTNPQVYALGGAVESLATNAQVAAAGAALSPIVDGAAVQLPINSAMMFHQQIDSRLDSFIYAQIPSSGRSADLGVARPVPVYGVLPANGAWIEGIGGGVHQSTVNGTPGYNAELEGVIGGYDRLIVPGLRVGAAFGYIDGRTNEQTNLGTRQNMQTYQGLAYASWEQERYYVRGSVGYGGVDFSSVRQIAFANFSDTAYGKHGGNIFTTRGEAGAPIEYLSSLFVPYAAFTYSHLNQDGYTETSGNGAALSYLGASNSSERSEAGGKIVVPLVNAPIFSTLFPTGSVVALEAHAAYVHEFGNVAQTVAASFTGGGNVFIASGPVPNRDMVDYGAGLRMGSGPVQIDISYNGLARSTYLQQVGLLRARYMF